MTTQMCRKARKAPIPFDCKSPRGHEGRCSIYTLPPTANYQEFLNRWGGFPTRRPSHD